MDAFFGKHLWISGCRTRPNIGTLRSQQAKWGNGFRTSCNGNPLGKSVSRQKSALCEFTSSWASEKNRTERLFFIFHRKTKNEAFANHKNKKTKLLPVYFPFINFQEKIVCCNHLFSFHIFCLISTLEWGLNEAFGNNVHNWLIDYQFFSKFSSLPLC